MKVRGVLFWAILLAAVVLRFAMAALALRYPDRALATDSPTYIEPAKYVLSSGYYSYPSAVRTPGYPYFIAFVYLVFGEQPAAVSAVQGVIGLCTVALTFVLGRALFSAQTALLSALLLALGLESIVATFFVLTETLFTLFLALALLCLLYFRRGGRLGWGAAAGILLGIAILIRPVALYFPILAAVLMLLPANPTGKTRLVGSGLFLVGVLVIVVPWVIRNRNVVGLATISTISNHNLLMYNAASLVAEKQSIRIAEARDILAERQREIIAANGIPDSVATRAVVETSLAREIIFADPLRYLALHLRDDLKNFLPGTGYLTEAVGLSGDGPDLWEVVRTEGLRSGLSQWVGRLGWVRLLIVPFALLLIVIYASSAVGLVHLVRKREWFTLLFLVLPLMYFLLLPGAPSNSRFRVPVMPYLDLMAAVGLMIVFTRNSGQNSSG